jgi:hypothetical protein
MDSERRESDAEPTPEGTQPAMGVVVTTDLGRSGRPGRCSTGWSRCWRATSTKRLREPVRDWSTWGGWGSWSSGRMSTAPPSSACALMRARAWSHGWMTKRRHIAIDQGAWPEEQAEAPPAQAASPVCCSVDGLNEVHALLPGNEVTVTLTAHDTAPSYRQRSTTDLRASSCPLSAAPCSPWHLAKMEQCKRGTNAKVQLQWRGRTHLAAHVD